MDRRRLMSVHSPRLLCLCLAPILMSVASPEPGPEAERIIIPFAGAGPYGFFGDGGPATEAWLWCAFKMAIDADGHLFIAENFNHRVRQVTPDGMILTAAGSGPVGASSGRYAGDGGAALRARLNWPEAVAVDGSGNLFVADNGNDRIRRIAPDGTISTVAGTGESGFSGDGGPATKAKLDFPLDVAVDRVGNLWIADRRRVRKVGTDGVIVTVAGGGTEEPTGSVPATSVRLGLVSAVAVDAMGNLYFADSHKHRVFKVGPGGLITTVAGTGEPGSSGDGGSATKARLKHPRGLAVDRAGNLFVAEGGSLAGLGLDGTAVLREAGRVRKVSPDGIITTVVGGGTGVLRLGGPAVPAALDPRGLAIDAEGNLLIAISTRVVMVPGVAAPGLLPQRPRPVEADEQGEPKPAETTDPIEARPEVQR